MNLIKPKKLKAGDTVAAISPSWAGASVYPHRYEAGKRQLEKEFGLKVVEAPNALISVAENAGSPQKRAADLNWALSNDEVKAIIPVIGGDDAIRLLPYIDYSLIAKNPKILLGYSDTTILHLAFLHAGVQSVYGPTFMAGGLAENGGMLDFFKNSMTKTLFSASPIGVIDPNIDAWTDEELPWKDPRNQDKKRRFKKPVGIKLMQGSGVVAGKLFGGCIEVLEMARGTPIWPQVEFFENTILFLETSEEAPPVNYVIRVMRNYAAMGILKRITGIIIGRPANVQENELDKYEKGVLQVVQQEYKLDTPILSQMDFGHTDPIFLIPYGAQAEIDTNRKTFSILENAVVEA